jgi:hypothetical protein
MSLYRLHLSEDEMDNVELIADTRRALSFAVLPTRLMCASGQHVSRLSSANNIHTLVQRSSFRKWSLFHSPNSLIRRKS